MQNQVHRIQTGREVGGGGTKGPYIPWGFGVGALSSATSTHGSDFFFS